VDNNAPARIHVIAVLVALTAALFARALIQVELRESGVQQPFAADLSYLVVPPVLLALLFPVLRANRDLLREQFGRANLDASLILQAVALGILLRLGWWCHVVAGVSLGLYSHDDPSLVHGLTLAFQCPPGYMLATGVFVMVFLVPIIEETIHRGYVQSYLRRLGPVFAICASAAAFAVFHPIGSWTFAFVAGLIFGTQYWISRSLWPSIVTHATINALVQLDWHCLRGRWSPPESLLPSASMAAAATILLVTCSVLVLILLMRMHRGERSPR